ncbi:MAG: hypothetical protein WA254_19605 [Candidatus Sulfotelmatobacter sp.]
MYDPLEDIDSYEDEYQQFQRDVYLLIEGTLNASKQYLGKECETELAKIKAAMDKTDDPDHHFYIQEEYGDVLLTNISQERFLRNMALVALASRLTHALRNMTKSAELFNPRVKRYEKMTNLSEFNRLWLEYSERFGIDFTDNTDRIAFVEPMREVRNQIVHEGAEAQTFRYLGDTDWNDGVLAFMDTSFAEKYPAYVSEDGNEVNVSEPQLKNAVESSVKLVGWLATELRAKELAFIKTRKHDKDHA